MDKIDKIKDEIAEEIAEAVEAKKRNWQQNRNDEFRKWLGIECGLRIALKIIER